MSNDIFLYVFMALAVVDLYFSMVQRTSVLICRVGDMPISIGGFLNPSFIKLAFPLTLIKWGWVAYWAWSGFTTQALVAFSLSLLANVILPVPGSLTLPPIFKQIEKVRVLDGNLGGTLLAAAKTWQVHGSRR